MTRVIWTVDVMKSTIRVDLGSWIVVVDVEVGAANAPVPIVRVGITSTVIIEITNVAPDLFRSNLPAGFEPLGLAVEPSLIPRRDCGYGGI